jgi:hypothetical protein
MASSDRCDVLLRQVLQVSHIYANTSRRRPGPDRRIRALALLIWFLCRNADLAVAVLLFKASSDDFGIDFIQDRAVACLTMLDWFRDRDVQALVLAGIDSLHDPLRQEADVYLVQSLLVEYICCMNARGLTVDLQQAVLVYLRFWSHRPVPEQLQRRLNRLVWHRNSRRHFGVALRRNWMLCLTTLSPGRDLAHSEIVDRVRTIQFPPKTKIASSTPLPLALPRYDPTLHRLMLCIQYPWQSSGCFGFVLSK